MINILCSVRLDEGFLQVTTSRDATYDRRLIMSTDETIGFYVFGWFILRVTTSSTATAASIEATFYCHILKQLLSS